MSLGEGERQPAIHRTEITLVTGDHYLIEGEPKDAERIILDAARGSIMQFAWLIDAETGDDLAINPEHVVSLRATRASTAR
jgi:hypothetical protein